MNFKSDIFLTLIGRPLQLHFRKRHFLTKYKMKPYLPSIFIFQRSHKNEAANCVNPDIVLTKTGTPTLSARLVASSSTRLRPYLYLMRMDRPIGSWLVFIPCAWSITMASEAGTLPSPQLLFLFGIGSMMMRGAGCIMNDMWDRDFDKMVDRTKNRPIACGQLSRWDAFVFMSVPLSISLSILLTFNWTTVFLGIASILPCALYPLMKRVTYWPQMVLGFTFNWGIIMGWSAIHGYPQLTVLPLYIASVSWTLVFDTIYAFQDIDDDLKIGLKSTAIRFGDYTRQWLTSFTIFTGTNLAFAGVLSDMTWPYYIGASVFTAHLLYQTLTVNLSDRLMCGNMFRSNRDVGLIFWAFIVLAVLLKKKNLDGDNLKKISNSDD